MKKLHYRNGLLIVAMLLVLIGTPNIVVAIQQMRSTPIENDEYQILAYLIGASRTENVISTGSDVALSSAVGQPFAGSDEGNPTYYLDSGFLAQIRALRSQQTVPTFDCNVVTEIPFLECGALVALYNSTAGDQWFDNTGWLQTTMPCTWYGVICTDGHVTDLILSGNSLNEYDFGLNGPIPAELGQLSHLERLHFHYNRLNGEIPVELGLLSNLRELYLFNNDLSGEIPVELGQLFSLEKIWLSSNNLTGSIPTEFGNLINLERIWISSNQLSGLIPPELGLLINLQELLLNNNQLSGPIPPELDQLTNLERLYLSDNALTGPVPDDFDFDQLTNLDRLYLHNNPLSGCLPESLAALSELSYFRFHNTLLTEPQTSAFQSWLDGVENLTRTNVPCDVTDRLLMIVAIAADNPPAHPANLVPYVVPMIEKLRLESETIPEKMVIVLLDREYDQDTTILSIQNGVISNMSNTNGLPDADGVQQPYIREYDMTDGVQLGGFLTWALNNYADAQTRTYFSYVGHGTAVAPAVEYPGNIGQTVENIPLPYIVGVNPAFTDMHPEPSLITPHDLQVALAIATDDGNAPIDIVDLSHCFAMTIEELTELANTDGNSYAQTFVGSPNYTYLAPDLPAAALVTIDPAESVDTNAIDLVEAYDATLATYEDGTVTHPGIWVAVHGSAVAAIESGMDALSVALLGRFDANVTETQTLLHAAYQMADAYYDTPTAVNEDDECVPDWAISNEDSLIDLKAFMQAIQTQFVAYADVVAAAQVVETAVDNVVLHKVTRNGTPWFADTAPTWTFDETNRSGIGLLGALTGVQSNDMTILPFPTTYYTPSMSVLAPNDNPYPFMFVQSDTASWANVLWRYWTSQEVTLATIACLPELQIIQQVGELQVEEITLPSVGTVAQFRPAPLVATVSADTNLFFINVLFEVLHEDTVIYSHLQGVSEVTSIPQSVTADAYWTPTLSPGTEFTVHVTIDPDDRVQELDEANTLTHTDTIAFEEPVTITATVKERRQWITDTVVPLEITSDSDELSALTVQLCQYKVEATNETLRVCLPIGDVTITELTDLSNVMLPLPANVQPGVIVGHVWGWYGDERSANFGTIQFNYAPPNHQLAVGESVEFVLSSEANEFWRFAFTGEATWYTQTPFMYWSAEMIEGNGVILIGASPVGEYVLRVDGDDTPYTLSVSRNGQPGRDVQTNPIIAEMDRPTFIDPVPQPPVLVPTAITLTGHTVAATPLPIVVLVGTALGTWFVLRRRFN